MTGVRNALAKDRLIREGWRFLRLGDHVTRIGSGITPLGGAATYVASGVPLIRSQNVLMNSFSKDGLAYISPLQDEEMAATRVQPGDVLLNITGASIGRVCVVPSDVCPANVNQHVCIIRLTDEIVPDYLAFFLASPLFQKRIGESQAGATRQALTKALIEEFQIPAPSIADQRRIAAILNERMAAVEKARRAAAVRSAAASKLTEAVLRGIFGLIERVDSPKVSLGSILRLRKDVLHPGSGESGQAVFVGLEHIESGTGERVGNAVLDKGALSGRKPRFQKGDLVYGYLRPYLNKVWVAEMDGLCSVDQYVYEVDRRQAQPDFVAWFMRSPLFKKRAPVDLSPGQLPRIRTEEVASVQIDLPDLMEQQRLCEEIAGRLDSVRKVRSALGNEVDALERLPAALLRPAFDGTL